MGFWGDNVDVARESQTDQCIHVRGTEKESGKSFLCSIIYAKCTYVERRDLWDNLISFGNSLSEPWMVGGDFNVVTKADEKLGGLQPNLRSMQEFHECISQCQLMDGGYFGSKYTWTNNQSGNARIWARLDRVLFNSAWEADARYFHLKILPRLYSDHSPLVVTGVSHQFVGPLPFRFQRMWVSHDEFNSFVETNWNIETAGLPPMKVLVAKLKHIRERLKWWNTNVFGNIQKKLHEIEDRVLQQEVHLPEAWSLEGNIELKKLQA